MVMLCLTQGDVIITCQKAIQYISRNDAELIGNVVVRQDSLIIETPTLFITAAKAGTEYFRTAAE
jgi:hypothetical protein